jgi:hypothetical protein
LERHENLDSLIGMRDLDISRLNDDGLNARVFSAQGRQAAAQAEQQRSEVYGIVSHQ